MTLRTTLLAIAGSLGVLLGVERCAEARGAAAAHTTDRLEAFAVRIRHERALQREAMQEADRLRATQAPARRAIAQLRDSIVRLTARPLAPAPQYVVTAGATPEALPLVRFAPDTTGYAAHPRVIAALDTFQQRDRQQAAELEARRALEARQDTLITQQAGETGALRAALAHADSGAAAGDQRAQLLDRAAHCRWGPWRAFPCLSRTELFVAGTAVGTIAALVIPRLLTPR